ncbi:MAG TPA: aminotransferase class I/II-fold pyridoxal phosphate-dependent enzyme [Pyrinomonadaceae bacterium]|nr:aminotransferase class I/II-fold pyridoxal phosphate-dependent enzyme [Pyrinomonadaceae bacterium]
MISSSERLSNFQYAIRNVVDSAERLERSGRSVSYLNIGDPQIFGFRPPEHLIEAVQRAVRDKFTGYTHSAGLLEAREAVATYATLLGSPLTPDDVILTSGASEAADIVLTALLNDGEEVLLPAPGYPIYPAILSKIGATPQYYRLNQARNWQPSVDEIASLINERTRAIVLINPNNPTGSITPDVVTSRILALAAEHDLLVISDEVYRELCFIPAPSPASVLADQLGTPLITLESLSKTHLVPGWRVGWMRFSQSHKMRDLMGAITRIASGRLCASALGQYAVRPALTGDRGFLNSFINEIKTRRDIAVSHVRNIEGLSCTTPDAAFYLMVKVDVPDGVSDHELVMEMLESTGVLTVHGSGFGCNPSEGYFRIVYLAEPSSLAFSLARIGEFITHLRANPSIALAG